MRNSLVAILNSYMKRNEFMYMQMLKYYLNYFII